MKLTLIFLGLLCALPLVAQESSEAQTLELRDKNYIEISLGKSNSKFRDFATSPLFYRGLPTAFGLRKTRDKSSTIVSFGMEYIFGNYHSNFNDHLATSQVKSLSFDYSRMYQSHLLNWEKTRLFLGAKAMGTVNLRVNPSLQNNAYGIEMFTNLLASAQLRKDISRKELKTKRFIFKYQLKPRRRALAYRLNLGVLNGNYRNGYAYLGQTAILNDFNLFEDYTYSLSGFRMGSQLDYTVFLNNNGLVFSYAWDALTTGNKKDKFEMSQHVFKLSILINK